MPADNFISQLPSEHHGNGDSPYSCYYKECKPSIASWSLDYGFCRHSLDTLFGAEDKRCPRDCTHKAPSKVVKEFNDVFMSKGAAKAALVAGCFKLMQE